MEGEVKGKTFKMKGHTLPGINQRSEGNTDLPDGRSKSSAFQQDFIDVGTATQRNLPPGAMGGVGMPGAFPSKPSMAKIYKKPKGKRTEY